jgi:glycosyltransferase involved in cell wall biosynthesis
VARNAGWSAATRPLIAFTDDDCRPADDWLANLLAPFDGADVVQGATTFDPTEAEGRGPFSQVISVRAWSGQFETSNIAYRRELLDALGGFDEQFEGDSYGEDVDLGWRAIERGARGTFAADAIVVHDTKRASALDEVRACVRRSRRWRHIGRVLRDHPGYRAQRLSNDPFLMPTHPPTWLAIGGLLVVAAAPRRRAAWLVGAGAFLPWLRYRTAVEPRPGARRRHWPIVLPAAFVVDAVRVVTVAASGVRYRTLVL